MIILFETVFMNIKEKTSATGAIFILSIYTAFINEIGSSFLSLESIHVSVILWNWAHTQKHFLLVRLKWNE